MVFMADKNKSDRVRFYVDLSPDEHRRLRYGAAVHGVTMKQILVNCIERLPQPPTDEQPSRTTEQKADYRTGD